MWNVRNKPENREQTQHSETKNRGVGIEHRGVCGMFVTNPKLENKPKTPKRKIVGRALSIVVCMWNVRNKPKTRKQKIVKDKIHLLQKVGKNYIQFISDSREK